MASDVVTEKSTDGLLLQGFVLELAPTAVPYGDPGWGRADEAARFPMGPDPHDRGAVRCIMPDPRIRFGRVVVLVPDLDAAADAYRSSFGWEVIADAEGASGRLLHVGPPSQPGVGVWFLVPSGERGRERVGAQTAGEPLLVLYTDDLDPAVERAEAAGMRTAGEAGEDGASRFRHLHDPFGNRIVLVELRGHPTGGSGERLP